MQRIPLVEQHRGTELRLHALFLQGLDGDEQAYRRFLQATAAHLRAFLRRRLGSWPDEVEDLVQECLLAIHNQRRSYDTAVPLTAWMHAIARYKLIDWFRRHARQGSLHDPLDEADDLFISADEESGRASYKPQGRKPRYVSLRCVLSTSLWGFDQADGCQIPSLASQSCNE